MCSVERIHAKQGLVESRDSECVRSMGCPKVPSLGGWQGPKPSPHPLPYSVRPAGRLHWPEFNHPERAPLITAQRCTMSLQQHRVKSRRLWERTQGWKPAELGSGSRQPPPCWITLGRPPPSQLLHLSPLVDSALGI